MNIHLRLLQEKTKKKLLALAYMFNLKPSVKQ